MDRMPGPGDDDLRPAQIERYLGAGVHAESLADGLG